MVIFFIARVPKLSISKCVCTEYRYSSKVNEKIDVYSFGVVLLELVTGREPYHGRDEYSNLAQWAWWHYSEAQPIADALDEEVKEDCYLEEMTDVFKLGLVCTNLVPEIRPSMKKVLLVLERCKSLEIDEGTKNANEPDFAPFVGSGSYISSCGNSRKEFEEDYYCMV